MEKLSGRRGTAPMVEVALELMGGEVKECKGEGRVKNVSFNKERRKNSAEQIHGIEMQQQITKLCTEKKSNILCTCHAM